MSRIGKEANLSFSEIIHKDADDIVLMLVIYVSGEQL